MVDVKVCSKCGASIPGQDIIDGKAKLINGELVCGKCAGSVAAGTAQSSEEAPGQAKSQSSPKAGGSISMPEQEPEKETGPAPTQSRPQTQPTRNPSRDDSPLKLEDTEEETAEIVVRGGGGAERKERQYQHKPNVTGEGAIRVRTFDTKLSRAAFQTLDEMVNGWLDENGFEVKHVTACIGDIHGKTTTEPHLIINVWY